MSYKFDLLSKTLIEKTMSGGLVWKPHRLRGYAGVHGYRADDGMGHIFKIVSDGLLLIQNEPTGLWYKGGNSVGLFDAAKEQYEQGVAFRQFKKQSESDAPFIDQVLEAVSKL